MAAKIYLPVVEREPGDTVFVLPDSNSGFAKGESDENLACGNCKRVIARNITTREVFEMFEVKHRLIIQCDCGANNLVQAAKF